jgi:hypothetical protein
VNEENNHKQKTKTRWQAMKTRILAMKSKNSYGSSMTTILCVYLALIVAPIMGQMKTDTPNEPSRLFTIPTTQTLPLGTISIGGGQAFGKMGSDFLGRLAVGIAPYTEIQINTQKIVYGVLNKEKIETSLTPAMKLQIPYIGEHSKWIPTFAFALRHNFRWSSDENECDGILYEYDKTLTNLFVFASRTIAVNTSVDLYLDFGYKMNSISIRLNDEEGHRIWPVKDEYYQKNVGGLFGGLSLRTGRKAWMMMEVEPIPNIPKPWLVDDSPVIDEGDISKIWLITVGTRYFLKPWIGFDIGAQYRSDSPDIADISILCGLNITFPLKKTDGSGVKSSSQNGSCHNCKTRHHWWIE